MQFREVDELRCRLVPLLFVSQTRPLQGVQNPGLRLRVLNEQVRCQVGQATDDQEVVAKREIDYAARRTSSDDA